MGKSILTTRKDHKNNKKREKIFFTEDGFELLPCKTQDSLPDWLKKEDRGLKVTIVAPKTELEMGWKYGYVSSLICNFFVAIF
jgi:hypothetical protein